MNPLRSHLRRRGFTLVEVVIAVAILALLFGAGTWGYLRTIQISEDKAAREAMTAIYAAKAEFLAAHPGTDLTKGPTEEQLVPLLTRGGKLAVQPRSTNDGGTKIDSGGQEKVGYPGLNGLLPSRYRVASIGGWMEYPTLNPAPPDPAGTLATLTPVNGGTIIITGPISGDPIDVPGIELPAGSPTKGGGPTTDPVTDPTDLPVELPVATPGGGKGDESNN